MSATMGEQQMEIDIALAWFDQVQRSLARHGSVTLFDGKLSIQQFRLLHEVNIKSELFSENEFARSLDVSPSVISNRMKRLLDKGLVTSREAKNDRRVCIFELTKQGELLHDHLEKSILSELQEAFRQVKESNIAGDAGFIS